MYVVHGDCDLHVDKWADVHVHVHDRNEKDVCKDIGYTLNV